MTVCPALTMGLDYRWLWIPQTVVPNRRSNVSQRLALFKRNVHNSMSKSWMRTNAVPSCSTVVIPKDSQDSVLPLEMKPTFYLTIYFQSTPIAAFTETTSPQLQLCMRSTATGRRNPARPACVYQAGGIRTTRPLFAKLPPAQKSRLKTSTTSWKTKGIPRTAVPRWSEQHASTKELRSGIMPWRILETPVSNTPVTMKEEVRASWSRERLRTNATLTVHWYVVSEVNGSRHS